MADLIDRFSILEEIDEKLNAEQWYPEDPIINQGLRIARKCIENATAVNRWIPCIKKLPEPLQNVIVCTDINTVTVAWLNGDHWTFADTGNGHTEDWSFDAVKFWMPLPEPPKEDET